MWSPAKTFMISPTTMYWPLLYGLDIKDMVVRRQTNPYALVGLIFRKRGGRGKLIK